MDKLIEGFNKYNVKVIYMSNKYRILSCGVNNNKATVRIHEFFKDCPIEVVNAIIGYYTDMQKSDVHLKIIREFIDKYYTTLNYTIKSPDSEFKNTLINNIKPIKKSSSDSEELLEYEIQSITATDMLNNKKTLSKEGIIHPKDDEMLDLDIVVKPLSTYTKEVK